LVVSNLWVGVEATCDSELLAAVGCHDDILVDLELATLGVDVELFLAGKSMGVSTLSSLELKRQDSHADEVASVDSLVALGNHSFDTLKVWAFSGPVAGRAGTVLITSEDDSLDACIHIGFSSVKDSHFLSSWDMHSSWANLRYHFVDQTSVGEGAASHNLIVTST